MKWPLVIGIAVLLSYLVLEIVPISHAMKVSADLVARTRSFQRAEGTQSMLVVGDSTAVGIGASDPRNTVAGRLSAYLDASVENYAVSGAVAADLAGQIAEAKKNRYDLVLVQIGANDVIKLLSLKSAQESLDTALETLEEKSDRIVVLTAGKIGNAPLFPWFIGPLFTYRSSLLRERFIATGAAHGATYIDLFAMKDPFNTDPTRYYGPDGLHLADDGYAFWYEAVKTGVGVRWPEITHGQTN